MLERTRKASWSDANQAFLVAEFARLRNLFESETNADVDSAAIRAEMESPPAIDVLASLFQLSDFERDVLLLCAAVEMDSKIAALCASAQGRAQRGHATFGLATSLLPDPHWSALAPDRPLRRHRLVEIEAEQGLTAGPLRIDERILHFLAGINALDQRLQALLRPAPAPGWIAESHEFVAEQVSRALAPAQGERPALQLCGDDPQGQEDVAAHAAAALGLTLFVLAIDDIPATRSEFEPFAALWERDAILLPGALLIQCGVNGVSPAARRLTERLASPLFLVGREPVRLSRLFLRFDVERPLPVEQKQLWRRALGADADKLDDLAQHFRLSAKTIFAAGQASTAFGEHANQPKEIWNACRALARPRLENLAQRVAASARWDDLILPAAQKQSLRQLADQVRHRMTVYEAWGFSDKARRGLGVSALFAGVSGTGKTLAAEVLALELGLDLYRVDLSNVVSKYIGETAKNLGQVFDAAEEGGVILLFDEADALFGKRSEVKDSHDRYANIEVGYLLQRMETYQGLAILTTNLKSTLDKAFQRRLRFIINFPFPDAEQREAIWRRAFPDKTPTRGLDAARLAQLNVPGGNIRNIALNAAFLAAAAGAAVDMSHVLDAARLESQKIERPLSESETRGWL